MTRHTAVALTWKSMEPVWVEQWPLPQEKLQALHALVKDQLQQQHIKPSTSPYNSPVFVIKKKSGKWRMLHDLRTVNALIEPMGPLQCGLPNPNLLPRNWQVAVVDLKDCFFCIPLQPQDHKYFAFTVPALNCEAPTARYEWTVLPQGMLNSPTMCQLFVHQALTPFRERYPFCKVVQYMDDIAVAAPQLPPNWQTTLSDDLQKFGLIIAPEKIQLQEPFQYLGHKLTKTYSMPVVPALNIKNLVTYIELQQLLEALNWIRPFFKIPTDQMATAPR